MLVKLCFYIIKHPYKILQNSTIPSKLPNLNAQKQNHFPSKHFLRQNPIKSHPELSPLWQSATGKPLAKFISLISISTFLETGHSTFDPCRERVLLNGNSTRIPPGPETFANPRKSSSSAAEVVKSRRGWAGRGFNQPSEHAITVNANGASFGRYLASFRFIDLMTKFWGANSAELTFLLEVNITGATYLPFWKGEFRGRFISGVGAGFAGTTCHEYRIR